MTDLIFDCTYCRHVYDATRAVVHPEDQVTLILACRLDRASFPAAVGCSGYAPKPQGFRAPLKGL